jgi:hypothetical protein
MALTEALRRDPLDLQAVHEAIRELVTWPLDEASEEIARARRLVVFVPAQGLARWHYVQATLQLAEALLVLPVEVREGMGGRLVGDVPGQGGGHG